MMPNLIEMDECLFLKITNQQESIKTLGVSSCLCLMLYGHLPNSTPFIGMHHWSGFAGPHRSTGYNAKDAVQDLVRFLSTEARQQLNLKKQESIYIDKIFIMGGEKAQSSLSGTEREVSALTDFFLKYCRQFFKIAEPLVFKSTHYLTSDEQSLDVTMPASEEPIWELAGTTETEATRMSP